MPKRDSSLYIIDIFIASDKISRYIDKFDTADELLWSEMEWDATMRELEIIGEATNALIKLETIENDKFRKIVDFRNIIIHDYFGIDECEVWDVVQNKIKSFVKELEDIAITKNIYLGDAIKCAKEENHKNTNIINFLNIILQNLKNRR
jgi:uncharacterized protein with HEPN domain